MRALAGVVGLVLIVLILLEFFLVYLLPRRVKRDPRLARQFFDIAWGPWRAVARRMSPRAADTWLGIFGPFGVMTILLLWVVGLLLGFALIYWALRANLGGTHDAFGTDLYYSGGALFSASPSGTPPGVVGHVARIAEAASGFGVIFIVIGYLPSLYQAFERREVAVSQLDPRAGSPPDAGTLLRRGADAGDWDAIDAYLHDWEGWTAELMETHLSYPVLMYFRSQHVNQNWLSALTTIMDACTFATAATRDGVALAAEMTYRIGRHALVDLSYVMHAEPVEPDERVRREDLRQLIGDLEAAGLVLEDEETVHERLTELRRSYEPYANGLAHRLALRLPQWSTPEQSRENWARDPRRPRRGRTDSRI